MIAYIILGILIVLYLFLSRKNKCQNCTMCEKCKERKQ